MGQTAEKLAELRAALAKAELEMPGERARLPLGHGAADDCLLGGILPGALHEVMAPSRHEASATGFAAMLAGRVSKRKFILWIRQDFAALEFGEPAATGFLEIGIAPERLLLLRLADAGDVLRAASDALACAALGAVVIELQGNPKSFDLAASRKLSLAAAQSGVTALLLRFQARPMANSAETRWLVRSHPSFKDNENWGAPLFEVELVRNRHGRNGRWVMEWKCDECLFAEPGAPHSGVVVPAAPHRSAA